MINTRHIYVALMLALASQGAYASCAIAAYTGIAADVATTAGAIESGRGVEANPIYPDNDAFYPTLALVAGLRAALVRYLDTNPEPMIATKGAGGSVSMVSPGVYNAYNCVHAALSWAAAGNNLAVWTGANSDRAKYAAAGAFVIVPILSFTF